jgi:dTDP-glucose 4,6-dehydratase
MRILITGGAGFIGSHLCDFLLEKGFEVACLDNLITGKKENIDQHLNNPKFKFIEHNASEYIKFDDDLDYILHFASPASPVDYLRHPIHTLKVGSLGTLNSLGLARAKKAKYLLASTSEVYGDPLVTPQTEEYWGNVNPVGPRGVYDEAKRFAESTTVAFQRVHGVDAKIARIFNTFGPRMRKDDGRAVPNFISQALAGEEITIYGDGSQTRSFCYISDMVEGLYKLMVSDANQPVNLGNPEERSILDLAKKILEITGSKSQIAFKPLPQDDPRVRRPDISRAKQILDWKPKVKLENGLVKTIDWFKNL